MGASRVSNKDILDGLNTGFDRLINALTADAISIETPANSEATPVQKSEVDPSYMAHQSLKAQEHATAKGEEVVLYTRRNKNGECKVAYSLRERFDSVVSKQPSCIGPVGSFQPVK